MQSAEIVQIVLLSLKVSVFAMIFVVPLAIAIAWWLHRSRFAGRAVISALLHIPLVLPPVVTGYLLLVALGPASAGGRFFAMLGIEFGFRWTGAALAAGVMAFPLVMRPIRQSFETIDPQLSDIASTLGVGRFMIFLTIALPMAVPGILAGSVLGFAKALGEFGATITFVSNIPGETRTLSLAVYTLLQTPSGDRAAFILIGLSVVVSMIAVLISEWLSGRILDKRQRSHD
jgi:molybdate transport system permease protein